MDRERVKGPAQIFKQQAHNRVAWSNSRLADAALYASRQPQPKVSRQNNQLGKHLPSPASSWCSRCQCRLRSRPF